MSRQAKVEGTKIAQAAKDLNVTSVTIRRYLTEFNIETTTDENGIKVLPPVAMEELQEIRKLKEDGLTNPRVLELLEEMRAKPKAEKPSKAKEKAKSAKAEPAAKEKDKEKDKDKSKEKEEKESKKADASEEPAVKTDKRKSPSKRAAKVQSEAEEPAEVVELTVTEESDEEMPGLEEAAEGRSKHSLTCQTCGKVFEHMNPRLRDCLDCYRAKRKERRRGGSERHKNVIQHPLAQSVASKAQPAVAEPKAERQERERPEKERVAAPVQAKETISFAPAMVKQAPVRNYRKAIEETRQITGSLKRRLERPDLPEGERRWLEQIYAYQLILHQGWRHLADYKATTQQQGKSHDD